MKNKIISTVWLFLFFLIYLFNPQNAIGEFENTEQNYLQENVQNYAPDSFIIKFQNGYNPIELQSQIEQRNTKRTTLLGKISVIRDDVLNSLSGNSSPEETLNDLEQIKTTANIINSENISIFDPDLFFFETDGSVPILEALEQFSDFPIQYAEPNYTYYTLNTPNDEYYDRLWGLKLINAPEAWNIKTGSKEIKVAVIDSGVDESHPDLKNNIIESKSFLSCPVQGQLLDHGTHVAGTIGAVGNNGLGIVGVNWNVGLYGLRVGCWGLSSRQRYEPLLDNRAIVKAIDYSIEKGINIINMSLGGPKSDFLADAIKRAVNRKITIVVAAGNNGSNDADSIYPASDPNVITVSALGPNNELAKYSSWGSSVDISAPGGNPPTGSSSCSPDSSNCIASTIPNNQYGNMAGTSMASPHVAGLAALILSVNPNLTPDQVQKIMQNTAVDLGATGKDEKFGYGRINAHAALLAAQGGTARPTEQPTVPVTGPATITPSGEPQPTASNVKAHLYFEPETQNVNKGEAITVVAGYDIGNTEISSISMRINYDYSNILTSDIENLNDNFNITSNSQEAGIIKINAVKKDGNSRISERSGLVRIHLETKNEGSFPLNFICGGGQSNESAIVDINNKNIIVCSENKNASVIVGKSIVVPTATPTPQVTRSAPSPGTTIEISEQCKQQKRAGDYDCDGRVIRQDYDLWEIDFIWERIERSDFYLFESWRRTFFKL